MTQMTRRSFLLSATTVTLTSLVGASIPANAINHLSSSDLYVPPIANLPKYLNLKLHLIPATNEQYLQIEWQFSIDPDFENIINQDSMRFGPNKQQFLNITLNEIPHNSSIFYRLTCKNCDAYEIDDLHFDNESVDISNIGLYPTKPLQETSLFTDHIPSRAERVY